MRDMQKSLKMNEIQIEKEHYRKIILEQLINLNQKIQANIRNNKGSNKNANIYNNL